MAALAQNFNYTDQAHFIHDFKSLTGYTPGRYAAGVPRVASVVKYVEFLQYPGLSLPYNEWHL